MLVGLTPPSIAEAIIFLILLGVLVDPVLLVGCVIALLLGGLLGAPLVTRARVWIVQLVVAIALVLAAIAYTMTNLHLFPGGGTASSLPLDLMIVAIVANFVFGMLLNFGVGNFAPTLVMFSLMGMDPRLCFPIMAGGAGTDRSGGQRPPYPDRADRPEDRARPGDRRHSGGAGRGIPRQIDAAGNAALAGDRGRALCRRSDVPLGIQGPARAPGRARRAERRTPSGPKSPPGEPSALAATICRSYCSASSSWICAPLPKAAWASLRSAG